MTSSLFTTMKRTTDKLRNDKVLPIISFSILFYNIYSSSAEPTCYFQKVSLFKNIFCKAYSFTRKGQICSVLAQIQTLVFTCHIHLHLFHLHSGKPLNRNPYPLFHVIGKLLQKPSQGEAVTLWLCCCDKLRKKKQNYLDLSWGTCVVASFVRHVQVFSRSMNRNYTQIYATL